MNFKRIFSMILALLMALSVFPVSAFAVTTEAGGSSASSSGGEVLYYDFELEKTDFTTTSNKKFAGIDFADKSVVPGIEELYNNADIDWKYATNNAALLKASGEFPNAQAMILYGGTSGYKWSGFRAGLKNGSEYPSGLWIALNIRVPFAGKYNLSLDHMTRGDGTTKGEVYLIEGGYNDAAAYNALNLGRRALVQRYDELLIAETDLLELKIDQIGEVTLAKKDLVADLLAIYEALPAKEKGYVKNYQTLNAADVTIQTIVNEAAAAKVQKMIDDTLKTLGEVTLEDEPAIKQLRAAYDDLTFAQRLLVNIDELVKVEAKITALRQEKVGYVQQLIQSIGEVTLEDESVIAEAMDLYNNFLDQNERAKVDYVTLLAANKAIVPLQKEAAAAVDALILAIGDTIDHSSKEAIEAARKAYDALTEGSKVYVKNLSILTEAEAVYAELGMSPTTIIIIVVVGVVVLAAAAVVVLLVLKKKKATAAEAPAAEETPEA